MTLNIGGNVGGDVSGGDMNKSTGGGGKRPDSRGPVRKALDALLDLVSVWRPWIK